MYLPYLTPWLKRNFEAGTDVRPRRGTAWRLERRRGGGGGGRGGGGGGGGGGKGGGSGGSGGSGRGTSRPVPISNSAGKGSASAYGNGGGKASTIPSGSAFAGRSVGGGDRSQVYGTRTYGSGYPGYGAYGVAGRGFPFYFWPITFGGIGGYGYYHSREYGDSKNSSRPGGPMTTLTFLSANPSDPNNSTFHILADNSTSTSLLISIYEACAPYFTPNPPTTANNSAPALVNDTDPNTPKPEQAVQFYRASSVALTLDGYNNSAALSDAVTSGNGGAGNVSDTPLPERRDATLLSCLNKTIGEAVPLIDGASARWTPTGGLSSVGLMWVVWCLIRSLI